MTAPSTAAVTARDADLTSFEAISLPTSPPDDTPTPPQPRWHGALMLLAILSLGLLIRVPGLDQDQLTFHPTRQYRSALIARSIVLERTRPASDVERQVLATAAARESTLEPPVNENIVAVFDQATGTTDVWLARLISSIVWLIGAAALWGIVARLGFGRTGQVVGTLAMVLLPLGVEGGRSFQPDALMTTLTLGSILALLRYARDRGWRPLVAAGVLAGFALFVKPMAAPMILAVFVAVQWPTARPRPNATSDRLTRRTLIGTSILFGVLAFTPLMGFYLHAILTSADMKSQADSSFVPGLVTSTAFYRDWLRQITTNFRPIFVVVAFAAIWAARGLAKRVLIALWIGYAIFGIAFSYRVATHSYYHLLLLPIIALGLAVVADHLLPLLKHRFDHRLATAAFGCAGILVGLVLVSDAASVSTAVTPTTQPTHTATRRIADLLDHSRNVLTVSQSYGKQLELEAGVVATEVPGEADLKLASLLGERAASQVEFVDRSAAKWLVVTDWAKWESMRSVRAHVESTYSLIDSGPGWAVFSLTSHPAKAHGRR